MVFASTFMFFHFLDHPLRDFLRLASGQNGCDLFARLDPNGMLLGEYFRNGEIRIPASQRKLHGFIGNDPLNLLMLRMCQMQPADHLQ